MEITYIGHSCFQLKGSTINIIIDPYDPKKTGYKLPKLKADVVLVTHDHADHNYAEGVADYRLLINAPGEYETNDVFIFGYSAFHDTDEGEERGINTIYLVDIDGFTVLHLGDLGHELSESTLENIDKVDVLMVPVGGKYTIDEEKASKVISAIEPGLVIPMHYATEDLAFKDDIKPVNEFLDEMGVSDVKEQENLKLTSASDISEETEVVLLKPHH